MTFPDNNDLSEDINGPLRPVPAAEGTDKKEQIELWQRATAVSTP